MNELRILVVEDSRRDLDLIVREFQLAGYSVQAERVETAQEMTDALAHGSFDIVISDNSLPSFDATSALAVLQATGSDIPFVILSGMIGEERAVQLMKAGASDFVSKRNLARLIPVVERELRDAAGRAERRRIESELAEMRDRQARMLNQRSALLDITNAVIGSLDGQSLCQAVFDVIKGSLVPCNSVVLALRKAETRSLDLVVAEAQPQSVEAAETALRALGETVIRTRERLVRKLPSEGHLLPGADALIAAGVAYAMAGPLITKGEPLGALILTGEMPGKQLLDMDFYFFDRVCSQVALAADNVTSYEKIAELKSRLERENAYLIEEIKSEHNFEEMVGTSPAFRALIEKVRMVAPTDATVLITGESGTGKELVARAIHSRSPRSDKPLVKVNCAAISAGLVESELFGHVKGAFTGALDRRIGRFEFAQGGTLFLDEVGELPLETQAKLLRVLQEHEFEPVGSNRTIRTDVRVIAATNRRLDQWVREGKFRADLYFRLNVVPIELPPLRDRKADIPELVSHILAQHNRQFGRRIESVADETMQRLIHYSWPGNIRELQNLLARAVVLSSGPVLRLGEDFLPSGATTVVPQAMAVAVPGNVQLPAATPGNQALNQVERNHIVEVLRDTQWVIEGQNGAAVRLGLHPNTLRSRMKKLNIQRPR
jgi:formate hydrogenlyase transcriptional activator